MKFLKKTLAYMLPAMMLLGGTSCSDFLDKAPENKVPEEGISCQSASWISEQGANIVLAGANI